MSGQPKRKNVCVDLDGVLADYKSGFRGLEHIGDPVPGAAEFTRELAKNYRVVIYTTRCKEDVGEVKEGDPGNANRGNRWRLARLVTDWLDKHGFYYDEVYIGQGKPWAVAYVDDRSVECRPQKFGASEFESALRAVEELARG